MGGWWVTGVWRGETYQHVIASSPFVEMEAFLCCVTLQQIYKLASCHQRTIKHILGSLVNKTDWTILCYLFNFSNLVLFKLFHSAQKSTWTCDLMCLFISNLLGSTKQILQQENVSFLAHSISTTTPIVCFIKIHCLIFHRSTGLCDSYKNQMVFEEACGLWGVLAAFPLQWQCSLLTIERWCIISQMHD